MNIIAVDPNSGKETLYLQYQFTNTCNYKCWYCWPDSHSATHRWPDLELIKKNLGSLIEHYQANGKKNIVINLTGGEPTLWPELSKFVKYFYDNYNCKFSLITNGSRTLSWWNEYACYFDRITISVHHESCDIEHIIRVADSAYKQNVIVESQVLMDSKSWDKCVTLVNELKRSRYKWMIAVKEILVDNQLIYNEAQKKYLLKSVKRKPGFFYHLFNNKLDNKKFTVTTENRQVKKVEYNTILVNGWNHFKGWECNLGVDSIFIDYTGRISGTCGEFLYGKDFYYNIHDLDFSEKFKPEIIPVICSKLGCYCAPEVNLKKRKIFLIKPVS
jgi:organic radical activating enzyme